jgi:hypothetical protein
MLYFSELEHCRTTITDVNCPLLETALQRAVKASTNRRETDDDDNRFTVVALRHTLLISSEMLETNKVTVAGLELHKHIEMHYPRRQY